MCVCVNEIESLVVFLFINPLQWKSHQDYFQLGLDFRDMSGEERVDSSPVPLAVEPGDNDGERQLEDPTDDDSHHSAELSEECIPEGERYTLNSKRLKAHRVQQIAEVLGIHREISVAEKRQVISSKLVELGYEVESVQVIIQGRGDDAPMFLVNENGIIKTIDYKALMAGPVPMLNCAVHREQCRMKTRNY